MCTETHWAAEDAIAGDAKARDWLAKWLLGLEWCGVPTPRWTKR